MSRAITPGYENLTLTSHDMTKIVEEVWSLLQVDNALDVLGDTSEQGHNTVALDARLQEILRSIYSHGSDTLSCWLRYSYNWSNALPTWLPLLSASYGIMLTRHPRNIVEQDLLFGLLPRSKQ